MPTIGITQDRTGAKMASISCRRGHVQVNELTSFADVESLLRAKKRGEVAVAVAEQKVLIKKVKTPSQSRRVLRKTLPFQLETLFSLPADGFFFHPFFSKKEATFVAAAAKREVEYLALRFNPETITTEQTAILHFVQNFCPKLESVCVCLATRAGIKVVLIEKRDFSRSTTFATEDTDHAASLLEQSIMKKKKVPFLFLGDRELRESFKKSVKGLREDAQEISLSLPESHLEYALEIGVALESASPISTSVQLRSEKFLPASASKKRWNVVYASLCVFFSLAGCAQYYFHQEYTRKEAQLLKEVSTVSSASPYLFKGVDKYRGYKAMLGAMNDKLLKVPQKKKYVDTPPKCVDALTLITTQFAKDGHTLVDYQFSLDKYPTIKKGKESYLARIVVKIGDADPVVVKKTVQALKKRAYFKESEITVRREEHGYILSCTTAS